jgi:ATP/maltotriose-dependent transcriptional regulator MalT
VAARRANAAYMQGRYEEADELTRESEQAARANDVAAQIEWRAVRAKAIACTGDLEAAESLAREAVAFAAESDFLIFHGHALVALAEVLRLAGRSTEAAATVEEAVAKYEQKGHLVWATKARALRAELPESVPH